MRRISSRMTFVHKRVFPLFWFGFISIFIAIALETMAKEKRVQVQLLLVPAIMAIFGYMVMKKLVFDLVDEMWDAGEELIAKNKGQEVHIPLSEITNVSYSNFSNPPRVTLTLRQPGQFGKEVAFSPPIRFNLFSKSPIIEELIERIDAKRRR